MICHSEPVFVPVQVGSGLSGVAPFFLFLRSKSAPNLRHPPEHARDVDGARGTRTRCVTGAGRARVAWCRGGMRRSEVFCRLVLVRGACVITQPKHFEQADDHQKIQNIL